MNSTNDMVLIQKFNKIYEDLGWLDYFSITKITDTRIYITLFTKYPISKTDKEFDVLIERNIKLGESLNREIIWDYSFSKGIFSFIKRFFILLRRK